MIRLDPRLLTRESTTALETRDAIPRPATFDASRNTVEAIIASSTPVQRQDQRGAFLEILDPAGLDLAASRGASVLDSHRQQGLASILGALDNVRIEGSQVIGTIRFSDRPEVAPVVSDVRSGIVSQLSVGYLVHEWREGTDAQGRRTRTAIKWTIRECSFVSVAADPTTRTRALADRAELDRSITELATRAGVPSDVADRLIARGASLETARADILYELQCRSAANVMRTEHNRQSLDNPHNRAAALGEAMFARMVPSHRPSAMAAPFVGLTIAEAARECLQRSGANTQGLAGVTLIDRALHTTSDFPGMLADGVNRSLRAAYDSTTSAVRRLARETTANDFRTKHRLQLDSSGMTLEKVTETGEFKHGSTTESEATYAISTFGKIFGISRQALVNDDLGAFADLSRRMGAAASSFEAQFLVDLIVANAGLGPTMKDGKTVFHTDHGNVSGTGAAPDEGTLSAARLAMRHQRGPDGGLIVVEPAFLVVPAEMETASEKLLTAIRAITVDDVNVFAKLALVVEPRFTDSKRWYVTANPAQCDGLEYAYLAGSPGPQVETQVGFDVDGMRIRVRLDFGGGFVDHRGWYSNAGQ
jgi:phage head maturation protease